MFTGARSGATTLYIFAVTGAMVGRHSASSDVSEEVLQRVLRENMEPGFQRDGLMGMAEHVFEPAFSLGRWMTWVPEAVFEPLALVLVFVPLVYNLVKLGEA